MYILLLVALTLSPVNFPTAGSDSVPQLRQRATQGDPNAQFWLGIAYERGKGVRSDQSRALHWILRSANAGNPDAQNWMGQAYEEGKAIRGNFIKAARWYSAACENQPDYGGAGQGCNNLGLLYFYGKGVPQSFPLAYLHARMARNDEQATLCLKHMNITQRESMDKQYADWLRRHAEKTTLSQ